MLFWVALICVLLAFFLPMFLSRGDGGPTFGMLLTLFTFIFFQLFTHTETKKRVSLSEVDYAVTEVAGEKKLFVQHRKGDFQTDKATLAENIGDTTQVEITLEKSESVWFGPSYYLHVKSK